jgi:nicotinate-nucleotide adenylyltransferase
MRFTMNKERERTMRVGFYGGSFDPPHNGHLAVARAAAKSFALDTVLLAPTAQQPLKPRGAEAAFADRLAMVRLLCAGEHGLQASELEAPDSSGASPPSSGDAAPNAAQPNYTIDTLRRLRAQLRPSDEIFVVVGIDAFLDLERWRDPRGLLVAAQWLVVARPEFAPERIAAMQLSATARARVHVLTDVQVPVSATEIRRALQAGEDCSEWLPQRVLDYIRKRGLYGAK